MCSGQSDIGAVIFFEYFGSSLPVIPPTWRMHVPFTCRWGYTILSKDIGLK